MCVRSVPAGNTVVEEQRQWAEEAVVEYEVVLVCRLVEAQQQEPLDVCSVLVLVRADQVLCSGALSVASLQPGGKTDITLRSSTSHPSEFKELIILRLI